MFDNYLITWKNSRFDLNSEMDLLWGDFQNPFFPMIFCLDGKVVRSNLDQYILLPSGSLFCRHMSMQVPVLSEAALALALHS
jgi:hypothetical protein